MAELDKPILIYTTCPSAELAHGIGASLVAARLAACVNIIPGMQSIYAWQGQIETATEFVVLIKTRTCLTDQVMAHVKTMHPYDTPAILTLPITGGSAPFLAWIMAETETGVAR
jgi:periplasmic divalent cation tolerance protein